MNLPDGLLPAAWQYIAQVLLALILAAVARRAPWRRLGEPAALHVFLGTSVAVLALWNLKAGVLPGLNFHFLGTSLLTLMVGGWLAVVAISLVLVAVTVSGAGGWQAYSLNVLLMGALPAAVTGAVLHLAERFLPPHLFIYIFVCGFFGAGLAMASTGLASTALFALSGTYRLDDLLQHYLPYYLLMVFPEAIITGSIVALLTVYRPGWIWTYNEDASLRQ